MEYFRIGKIVSTHGTDGKMVLRHSLGAKTAFEGTETIFFEEKNESFFPWFLKSASAKTEDETFIEIEGIDSKEAARKLLKKEVWLTEEDFNRLASTSSSISLLGYSIVENKKNLGVIEEIIDQSHQILCKIVINNREAWIPLHGETLTKINHKRKEVLVQLPDGLLDVYLE